MRPFFSGLRLLPLHAPLWRLGPHLRRRHDFFRSTREKRDPPRRTACRDPTAAIALRSRAVPLSLALALALSRSRSASDDPSEFSELRAEREATPFCALSLALARRDKPLTEAFLQSVVLSSFFLLPLPGAAGLKKYGPAHQGRGIACTVLEPAL